MSQQNQHLYEFDAFCLDAEKRTLLRHGKLVPLAPKAFDMLLVLIRHQGQVLDKELLMEMLWPDSIVEEANLPQNISILRKALGESPSERKYITTISGKGYKFTADIKKASGKAEVVLERYSKATVIVEEQEEENQESLFDGKSKSLPAPNLLTHPWRSKIGLMALLITGVAVSTILYFFLFHKAKVTPPQKAIQLFAVLPFKPLNADQDDEYLGLGMTDTLITKLSNLKEVIVRPTSAILKYGNQAKDPIEAGRELGVEAVLEGSIQRAGERVRVNVRLVKVTDGSALWAEKFDEKFTNILALQDAISERVAESLSLKLNGKDKEMIARRYTENTEAYQLYLRGRFHNFKLTPQGVQQGLSYFQQAIAIDPNYALAYAGIADTYRSIALSAEILPTETLPKSKAAANKAIEIDDTLSEGHTSLGMTIFWSDWDWSTAENQFKRALELNPNNSSAHLHYAHLLSNTGRHAEALAEAKLAREFDPLFPFGNALEGQFLLHAGRTDEALDRLQKTFELAPNFWMPHLFASSAYTEKGMYVEAIAEARKARELLPTLTASNAYEAYALAKAGRRAEAQAMLNELLKLSIGRFVPPYHIALIYNGLGERDKALEWLEKGYEQRDPKMTFLKVESKWNNLRTDPRFQDLLRRIGFTP